VEQKFNGTHQLLVYVEDINLIGNNTVKKYKGTNEKAALGVTKMQGKIITNKVASLPIL
jgi:hypothetical protein